MINNGCSEMTAGSNDYSRLQNFYTIHPVYVSSGERERERVY